MNRYVTPYFDEMLLIDALEITLSRRRDVHGGAAVVEDGCMVPVDSKYQVGGRIAARRSAGGSCSYTNASSFSL